MGNEEKNHPSSIMANAFGKDRVVDFRENLSYANPNDYAMIHGCGGKGHAYNSTVECVICDYTKGKGDNSVTVSYGLPIFAVHRLYEAAVKASLGELCVGSNLTAVSNKILMWLQEINNIDLSSSLQNASNDELLDTLMRFYDYAKKGCWSIGCELYDALKSSNSDGIVVYKGEKSNPYALRPDGYAPVSTIQICYKPVMQDGSASRYPWHIQIANFLAPLKKQANGSSYHVSKDAKNRQSASIMLSVDDFERCMNSCSSFIRNWEALYAPAIMDALRAKEAARQTNRD